MPVNQAAVRFCSTAQRQAMFTIRNNVERKNLGHNCQLLLPRLSRLLGGLNELQQQQTRSKI